MTTTFENAVIGDKIYSVKHDWCEVIDIYKDDPYPIVLRIEGIDNDLYDIRITFDGKHAKHDKYQTFFWDKVDIIAPYKPHPELKIDTKLIVWDKEYPLDTYKRYFAFFKDDLVCCFEGGLTSWSAENYDNVESWDFYEVVISMPEDIDVNKN